MEQRKGSRRLRKGRTSIVGQYYFFTTRTYNCQRIFENPEATVVVFEALHWLESQKRINLQAAVVMPDHLHIIARLQQDTLSSLMQSLKGFTSRRLKELLGLSGPIWQSQYHDHAIRTDNVLMDAIRYCLHNPVRANLVHDFREYPYWYCRFEI